MVTITEVDDSFFKQPVLSFQKTWKYGAWAKFRVFFERHSPHPLALYLKKQLWRSANVLGAEWHEDE